MKDHRGGWTVKVLFAREPWEVIYIPDLRHIATRFGSTVTPMPMTRGELFLMGARAMWAAIRGKR